jgi:hypothetical protein
LETKEAIKWATLGDMGTKFFYANATTRHRRNYITSFRSENGDIITSHPGMESLIWDTFKQRIGQTDFRGTLFDLSSLIQRHDNLDSLEEQFTSAKIDKVVKQLPNDKAPGPNGFIMNSSRNFGTTSNLICMIFAGPFRITMFVSKVLTHLSSPWFLGFKVPAVSDFTPFPCLTTL